MLDKNGARYVAASHFDNVLRDEGLKVDDANRFAEVFDTRGDCTVDLQAFGHWASSLVDGPVLSPNASDAVDAARKALRKLRAEERAEHQRAKGKSAKKKKKEKKKKKRKKKRDDDDDDDDDDDSKPFVSSISLEEMFSRADSGSRGTVKASALEAICYERLELKKTHVKAIVRAFADGGSCDYYPFVRIVETHGEPETTDEMTPRLRAAALALRRRAATGAGNDGDNEHDVASVLAQTIGGAITAVAAENDDGQSVLPAGEVLRILSSTFAFPMTTAELCFLCVSAASHQKKARSQLEKEKDKLSRWVLLQSSSERTRDPF